MLPGPGLAHKLDKYGIGIKNALCLGLLPGRVVNR
jgi:hypothetical protein